MNKQWIVVVSAVLLITPLTASFIAMNASADPSYWVEVEYPNGGEEVSGVVTIEVTAHPDWTKGEGWLMTFSVERVEPDGIGVLWSRWLDVYIVEEECIYQGEGDYYCECDWNTLLEDDGPNYKISTSMWVVDGAAHTWDRSDNVFAVNNLDAAPVYTQVLDPNGYPHAKQQINGDYQLKANVYSGIYDIEEAKFYYKTYENPTQLIEIGDAVETESNVYTLTWDTTKVANGDYKIEIYAKNTEDNEDWDASDDWFEVANVGSLRPLVTVIDPNGSPWYTSQEPVSGTKEITVTADDPDGSVQSVDFYYIDRRDEWDEVYIGTDTTPTSYLGHDWWTCDWDTTDVDDGQYKILAIAEDNTNDEGTDLSDWWFEVDNHALPDVVVTHPESKELVAGEEVLVQARVKSNTPSGGISEVFFEYIPRQDNPENEMFDIGEGEYVGTEEIEEETWKIYEYEWDSTEVDDGEYAIHAVVTDDQDQENCRVSGDFIVDNDPDPLYVTVIHINGDPGEATEVSGTQILVADAEVTTGSVSKVEFYWMNAQTSTKNYIGEDTSSTGGWTCSWDTTQVSNTYYKIYIIGYHSSEYEDEDYSDNWFTVDND